MKRKTPVKKLLNLFATISLITTGTTNVVACCNDRSSSNPNKDAVDTIVNKIKNRIIDTLNYMDYETNNATDQQTLLKGNWLKVCVKIPKLL